MEFLRSLVRSKRQEAKDEIPDPAVKPYLKKARKFVAELGLDSSLQLQSEDLSILYLLIASRYLYWQIDSSKGKAQGTNKHTGEDYSMQFDTPETQTLREISSRVQGVLENFIADNYSGGLNRARAIQNAVNNLFSDRYDENGNIIPWNRQEFAQWARTWKEQIHSPNQSIQS